MYSQRALVLLGLRLGHRLGDRHDHPRVRPPGDHRADRGGVDVDLAVERRAVVGLQRTATRSGTSAGRAGRPITHSNVVSSGAIIPARPPPSIVMLQTVIRPSIESASIAGPAYSTTWPTAPSTPIWPIVARIRSLAVTPKPSSPS